MRLTAHLEVNNDNPRWHWFELNLLKKYNVPEIEHALGILGTTFVYHYHIVNMDMNAYNRPMRLAKIANGLDEYGKVTNHEVAKAIARNYREIDDRLAHYEPLVKWLDELGFAVGLNGYTAPPLITIMFDSLDGERVFITIYEKRDKDTD